MANLLVDIGSTALKASWADGVTLGKTFRYQGEKNVEYILHLVSKEKPRTLAISSVREFTDAEVSSLEQNCGRLVLMTPRRNALNSVFDLPDYISPDRVASVEAARYLFGGKNCSIFDFGTVLAIDFVSSEGKYLGGNISVGCRTRFKALARYSRSFPLRDTPQCVPETTDSLESSVDAGIVRGMLFEVEGYIAKYPENIVIFAGGDANYFAKQMKSPIFVVSNIVLMGLALIAAKDEENE